MTSERWAEVDIDDDLDIPFTDVNPVETSQMALLVFYDCHLKFPKGKPDEHRLPAALNLDAEVWNMPFDKCTVKKFCEAGVSMHRGVDHSDIHTMSFSLTLALVETKSLNLQAGRCYLTKSEEKTKISRSSVTVFPLNGHSRHILDDFVNKDKVGLWEIAEKFADEPQFLLTLKCIAHKHAEHLDEKEREYKNQRRGKHSHKEISLPNGFSECKDRAKNFGRCVERMLIAYKHGHNAPLSCGPCLSGFSDAKEFAKMPDPCKCGTKSFNAHLENMCNCGHLSIRVHKDHFSRNVGSTYEKEQLLPVAVHNLKATAVEKVLACNIDYIIRGSVVKRVNEQEKEQSIFVADKLPAVFERDQPQLKNRIAFLMDADAAQKLQLEEAKRIQDVCAEIVLPVSALTAHGEFHLLAANTDRALEIALERPCALRGCVSMWIGGYAGAEAFAAEALFKKYGTDLSRAACNLVACQSPDVQFETESLLAGVKSENANRHLQKRNITLTAEQCKYIDDLQKRVVCSAVAGAGKSTTGAAILLETIEILNNRAKSDDGLGNFKTVWLTKTREQRDDILKNLRKLVSDPLEVCSAGRPADNFAIAEDDGHFDEHFEASLAKFVQQEIKLSTELLRAIASESDNYSREDLQAEYYKVQLAMEEKKHHALQSYPFVFLT